MYNNEYISLFRTIARDNKLILHVEAEAKKKFFRIIRTSGDPFQALYLNEFLRAMRSSIAYPCLIAEAYDLQLHDNKADNIRKLYMGGFIILDQHAAKEDFSDMEAKLTSTETIAWQVLSYLRRYFLIRRNNVQLNPRIDFDVSSVTMEKVIIETDKLVGQRVDFSFTALANEDMAFDEEEWNNTVMVWP